MRLHHVGIACREMEAGSAAIRKLYDVVEVSPVVFDPHQNAEVRLLTLRDGSHLELVAGERVRGLLQRGFTYYHLCYEVPDLAAGIAKLREGGAMLVSEPKPAPLFQNRAVAFLQTVLGLVELLEESGRPDERSQTP
jgi:methylmalonyl-CoA/ethylmalonyl-CoA epimerase